MSWVARTGWLGIGGRVTFLVALPVLVAASTPRHERASAAVGLLRDDATLLTEAAPLRAICAGAINAEPPTSDQPSSAQVVDLADCDSEALLYGIGRAADPVAARRCAILERDEENGGDLPYFSGTGILAVAYANGWGAARNLRVATHLACGLDDAVAATESRVAHLHGLERSGIRRPPFGICDDATSGISGGQCAAHDALLQEQARAQAFARLRRGWSTGRQAAFDRLYASMSAYAEAAHELDCHGGTAAIDCAIRGAQRDLDRFLAKMGALLDHRTAPRTSSREDRTNAATDPAGWNRMIADMAVDDREPYFANGRDVVATRARFERDLMAFAAQVPGMTPHGTRAMFADL